MGVRAASVGWWWPQGGRGGGLAEPRSLGNALKHTKEEPVRSGWPRTNLSGTGQRVAAGGDRGRRGAGAEPERSRGPMTSGRPRAGHKRPRAGAARG